MVNVTNDFSLVITGYLSNKSQYSSLKLLNFTVCTKKHSSTSQMKLLSYVFYLQGLDGDDQLRGAFHFSLT